MNSLNVKQLKDYKDHGFVAPINVLSLEEVKKIKEEIEYIEKKWPEELVGLGRNNVHYISPVFDQVCHDSKILDAFGHHQLGGVAPILAKLIKHTHGYKYHWAIADYLQRSARHIASQTDYEQAYAIGKAAVEFAIDGINNVMLTIVREEAPVYQWHVGSVPLHKVANVEKKLPRSFMNKEGFGITKACREYLTPLTEGESYPIYQSGIPHYVRLNNKLVAKKLTKVT